MSPVSPLSPVSPVSPVGPLSESPPKVVIKFKLILRVTTLCIPFIVAVARTVTELFVFEVSPVIVTVKLSESIIEAAVIEAALDETSNTTVAPDGLFKFSVRSSRTTPLKDPSAFVNISTG